jgi:glycosyltransferase involved in cell wall biosynthesis
VKLLIYSHFFAPSIGGVETIVLSLARGLTELRNSTGAREFEITLVTQTPAGNYDDGLLPFRVVRQPGSVQLWQLIRSSDIVHLGGPALAPLFLSRLVRKPLAIEHHGYQATCPNGLLFHHPTQSVCRGHFEAGNYLECWNCNKKIEGGAGALRLLISTFFRRAGSRSAAKNIAPSRHVASRQGLPRTTVIPHGVQAPLDSAEVQTQAQPRDKHSFAYLGRLVVEKGVPVLVEAARLLRADGMSVRVLLIGDGPGRAHLQQQITAAQLESCVQITGFLSGVALQRELLEVGTIVIPTIMEETAGLAALEQMARGRAVIASAIGGLGEMVNGVGLTFTPGDPAALARAMRRILDEPGLASSLAALGRQRVLQSFSLSAMIDAHARVYRDSMFPGEISPLA